MVGVAIECLAKCRKRRGVERHQRRLPGRNVGPREEPGAAPEQDERNRGDGALSCQWAHGIIVAQLAVIAYGRAGDEQRPNGS